MQGSFIWYELMTTDTAAAARFYGEVVGWKAEDSGMPGMAYTIFKVPGFEMGVAGMMAMTEDVKARGVGANWTGYVWVEDVDATAASYKEKGGIVHRAPDDIPGIGRFAVLADPQGAVLCVMTPKMPGGPMPPAPARTAPGTIGWNELMAGNGEEAFAFYATEFGWSKELAVDMGAMGIYQCFGVDGIAIGGMMTKPATIPHPYWGYYVTVEALDAAIARAVARGGKVLTGPHEVPGGSFVVQCADPQGAFFAMTSGTR